MKNPKNGPFSIGASRQFSTHANGENNSKRSRQLALCPRVALAPANLRSVFLKLNGGIFVLTDPGTDIYLELGSLAMDFHREEVVCHLSWKLP